MVDPPSIKPVRTKELGCNNNEPRDRMLNNNMFVSIHNEIARSSDIKSCSCGLVYV